MSDLADYSQGVQVLGGSVSVLGTATVQITGTPTVSISGTPTVNVGNTPAVTISSGTVNATITGTPNINIQSQSVSLNVVLPQALQATINVVGSGNQNVAVPTGCHALGIGIGANALGSLKVTGLQSGINYWPGAAQNSAAIGAGAYVVVPVFSALDTSVTVTWTFTGNTTIWVLAILDTEAVVPFPSQVGNVPGFMGVTLYDPAVSASASIIGQRAMAKSLPVALAADQTVSAFQAPNKPPATFQLVAGANQQVIAGVAGQKIYLFSISLTNDVVVGANQSDFLDGNGGTSICKMGTASLTPPPFDGKGSPLTAGNGLFVTVPAGEAIRGTVAYSQA